MRLIFAGLLLLVACHQVDKEGAAEDTTPYLVMVSIDGFRYDYAGLHGAKNIERIGEEGVSTPEGMVPSYPSKTFPNHYTLATGLYPDNHGLVANSFYDPQRDEKYQTRDRTKVEDGTWYGGTPLWVLAEQQGVRSASFFWVGSEADIQGVLPSDYYKYDGSIPDRDRVDQVIDWLKRPEETRPNLVMLYFSLVDDAGHSYGPEDPGTKEAVLSVDETIGYLDAQLQQLDIPVNLIVTADHGMHVINTKKPIFYQDFADFSDFKVIHSDAIVLMYQSDSTKLAEAYQKVLRKQQEQPEKFSVYTRNNIPEYLKYGKHQRAGDLIFVPHPPYIFGKKFSGAGLVEKGGTHGFDPYKVKEMRAIFYAKGPNFKQGETVESFRNIHVFPMAAQLLGLEYHHPIDGDVEVLENILQLAE